MKKYEKLIAGMLTLLFAAGVLLFFGMCYPQHLHYQEQYQLFQFTGEYFLRCLAVPGGLADWVGELLTQFFFFAWVGASLIALLLMLIQLTTAALARPRSLTGWVLTFLPAAALLFFLGDENALMSGPVAVWLALLAALGVSVIRPRGVRWALALLLIPVLYMLAGSLALVYVLLMLVTEWRRDDRTVREKLILTLIAIVLTAATLLVARLLFPYPMRNICLGIHYHRMRSILPLWVWIAGVSAVIPLLLSQCAQGRRRLLVGSIAALLLLALTAANMRLCIDLSKERTMQYDYMARMHMWNKTLLEAGKRQPANPLTVSCMNLALAKTGRMADNMFTYFQNGPEGLLPSFQRDFTSPLATAEAFYQMGMINTAQRYTFEAQEAIPDYRKSARCYRRLAETNLINGDTEVARKYLIPLTHTLYYKTWARQTLALLDDEAAIDAHPEYGLLRKMRPQHHDFMFSSGETDSMLGILYSECPSNTLARDYLMAWCLLKKDLKRFAECLQVMPLIEMPRSYQEAWLLMWVQSHGNFNDLPAFIDVRYAQRLEAFMQDSQRKTDVATMQKKYGDTYWYYYIYRYNPNPEEQ